MCISFSFFNVTNVGTELQRKAITGVTRECFQGREALCCRNTITYSLES